MRLCLAESRGAATEVGLAAMDEENGCLVLVDQLIESTGYGKTLRAIALLAPHTILVSDSGCRSSSPSKLHLTLQNEIGACEFISLPRSQFDEEAGWRGLRRLCLPEQVPALEIALNRKHYAMACLGALLQQPEYAGLHLGCLQIKSCILNDCLMAIDYFTVKNLELLRNQSTGGGSGVQGTLLACLDDCQTPMGRSMLRMNLLQPPADLPTVEGRHGCIRELDNLADFLSLRQELSRLPDLDRLLSQLIRTGPVSADLLGQAVSLQKTMRSMHSLAIMLRPVTHAILVAIRENIAGCVAEMRPLLDAVLGEEALAGERSRALSHHVKCYAVKAEGRSSLLEVARRTLSENVDDVYEYARVLGETLHQEMDLHWAKSGGFMLRLKSAAAVQLPTDFIALKPAKRTGQQVTTLELCRLNERISESIAEIEQLSNRILRETMDQIRMEYLGSLYRATESLAYLDFLACASNWGRDKLLPAFSEDSLAFREARHPLLGAQATSNSLLLNREHGFLLVHGANGAGKSSFLRQVALLQIIAQMGWAVPAEFACFRLADRLIARLGSDDDFESNSSTLHLELKELSYALQEATDRSLILLDELGRGTSVLEGMALTAALSEHFILHRHCLVLLVSHFERVIFYLDMFNAVVLVHLGPQFRVIPGPMTSEHYGLEMAQRLGLPTSLLEAAQQALGRLQAQQGEDEEGRMVRRLVAKRKLIYVTAQRVRALAGDRAALAQIKRDFISQLDQINEA